MPQKDMAFSFQSQRETGCPEFFKTQIDVRYSVDPNHQADRDGNRGIQELFIDDIKIFEVKDLENNLVNPTEEIEDDIWSYVWEHLEV